MTVNISEPALRPSAGISATESKRAFHPGWVILGIAAASQFMSAPGQSYSVAAFIDPMLADLGMLRSEYATAYLFATLVSGLTLPMMGRFLDSYGARRMLPFVALLLGVACVWMSQIQHVAGLYAGFSMIRCLGQGTLTLISTWLIGEWYHRRRGLAMGLMGLGGTLSVMSFPQINNALIAEFGWRTTWLFLAVAVWIILVIPGRLLVRDRPEDLGLLPDGEIPDEPFSDAPPVRPTTGPWEREVSERIEESWTVGQVWRNATFWKLLAVVSTGSMIGTGLIFHQVSLLGEHGVSRSGALGLIGVQALVATVSSVVFGYLSDRIQTRYLLAASMTCLCSAMLLLIATSSAIWAIPYACLLGLHGGIMRSTGTVVWVNFYGRLHQGAVRGLAMSFAVAAAALGPLPLALAKDHLGSYSAALIGFLLLPVLSAILVWTTRIPVKRNTV